MSPAVTSRALIHLGNYAHNLGIVRRLAGEHTAIAAVVKANAYGHGMLPVARKAIACNVRMLAVATVEEGVELREAGIETPILVLFQPHRDAFPDAIAHGLALMMCDSDATRELGEVALREDKVAAVHCMIDTGMGRQGFNPETAQDDLQFLAHLSRIDIQGIATHFPSADLSEDAFTYGQIKKFRQLLKYAAKSGIPFECAHAANSGAIVNYPASIFDMVRPGLMSYGVWPAVDTPHNSLVRRVLRWETRVTQVKPLDTGESVGYGRTYTTPKRMLAAVLPIGYADGYQRSLSNKAEVLIRGRRCPVRGSVCMDQIVVDVTSLPECKEGDIATLVGTDGADEITVDELARHAGTISYEILTGIGRRVIREYIE